MFPEIIQVDSFALRAAEWIITQLEAAIAEQGLFRLALAGGETPAAVYREMARLGSHLPWERVQLTFGDERCVQPTDPQSNFLMAKESLLDHIAIPAGNVFRMRGEIDPEQAALDYEAKLAAIAKRFGEARYTHDLVLLGLGPDGHTASLFPGSPAIEETVRNIVPAIGPKPPPQRLTMTVPLLNAARHICFLINNPASKPVIHQVLAGDQSYPGARIQPANGQLTWIMGGPL